jgi:hypothetical protein
LAWQTLPLVHSAFVVHSFTVPPDVPGATHWFDLHTAPLGQSPSVLHVWTQPLSVQTLPDGQDVFPVHGVAAGGFTFRQP